MRPCHAQLIVEAAEDMGIEAEARESYSGRGMMGSETAAVVLDSMSQLCGCVAHATHMMCMEDVDPDDFVEDVRNLRFDSMGMGIVAY